MSSLHKLKQNLASDKTLVMGVLNLTTDSFSDGGKFIAQDTAKKQIDIMLKGGVDIIDVGGESTRPGAASIGVNEELDRVMPIIEYLTQQQEVPISVDTSKSEIMKVACETGVDMINDVNALQAPGALETVSEFDVLVCLMHMQGMPCTMQHKPQYDDVIAEVKQFFLDRIERCVAVGIKKQNLLIDPGFGFGKLMEHNLQLLANLDLLKAFNLPILVGLSRKSMLGEITAKPVDQRLFASLAAAAIACWNHAKIIRVHDVAETVDVIKVVDAILNFKINTLGRDG